ncbi:hypothetical protein OAO18_05505 [Francisellaceae bacterium]|nr:hypothetical protein [Francisellaceae bacterium]
MLIGVSILITNLNTALGIDSIAGKPNQDTSVSNKKIQENDTRSQIAKMTPEEIKKISH